MTTGLRAGAVPLHGYAARVAPTATRVVKDTGCGAWIAVIAGQVPRAGIRRLRPGRPDAVGLSVPGMGPDSEGAAHAVHLIRKDGTTGIFATSDAA